MIRARTRRIIQGSDYSAQEPRVLTQLCKDEGMLQAYREGKDLYVAIASIANHVPYKECLEFFPKGTPIIFDQETQHWHYAKLKSGEDDDIKNFEDLGRYLEPDFNPELYNYEKLADGETDTYKEGKELRGQAKRILLGIMYSRGEKSIAEQLGCSIEEAREIKNNVYLAFPKIKEFEIASAKLVKDMGFVTTLWGRQRHLSDYNLPKYEIFYVDENGNRINTPVPKSIQEEVTKKIEDTYWTKRDELHAVFKDKDRIDFIDNQSKIATASRQIINSRVQGCLDGDTEIFTNLGVVKIKDYVNRDDLKIWDGEDWTNGTIAYSGKKQKCIVELEHSTIICSPDHKFKVVLPDDTRIWKKCSELTVDDEVEEDN